jgi:hypothetical protein
MSRKKKPIFDWNITTPVERVIGEAIGAASSCWEHPERAGIYDSERASQIADELMTILKQKLWIVQEE